MQRVEIIGTLPEIKMHPSMDVATDGVAVTGQTLETGGVTQIGWLSSIRKAIMDRLPAALVGNRLDVNIGNTPAVTVAALTDGSARVGGTVAVSLASAPTTPVTGTFWQTTQPVSLAVAPSTPVTGTFWQTTQPVSMATNTPTESRPGSPTVSVADFSLISDTTRALTLAAANASRRGATIRNDQDQPLLIKEGAGASPTSYTDVIPPRGVYVLDYPASTGELSAYCPVMPNGRVLVTERV